MKEREQNKEVIVDTKSGTGEEGIQMTSLSWNCFNSVVAGAQVRRNPWTEAEDVHWSVTSDTQTTLRQRSPPA